MRLPIEHPAASIGPQNKHALDTLGVAYSCALRLAEEGYTIIRVLVENHKPLIWIQPCQHCSQLCGSEYKWNRHESVLQADVDGCRVQWKVMH